MWVRLAKARACCTVGWAAPSNQARHFGHVASCPSPSPARSAAQRNIAGLTLTRFVISASPPLRSHLMLPVDSIIAASRAFLSPLT